MRARPWPPWIGCSAAEASMGRGMRGLLDHKVCLIARAARGIGAVIAEEFLGMETEEDAVGQLGDTKRIVPPLMHHLGPTGGRRGPPLQRWPRMASCGEDTAAAMRCWREKQQRGHEESRVPFCIVCGMSRHYNHVELSKLSQRGEYTKESCPQCYEGTQRYCVAPTPRKE